MNFQETVFQRLKTLKQILSEKQSILSCSPEGRLEIRKRGKKTQYFHVKPGERKGTYIRKKDISLASSLAQKSYDIAVIEKVANEITILEALLSEWGSGTMDNIIDKYSLVRQKLITPIRLTDSAFIETWEAVEYEPKPISEDVADFFTNKGEHVRSKSEVMIADALKKFHVPYRYEYPLQLGKVTVHPDFTVLNVRERKELYWEHFGMMDDYEYRENAISKTKKYIHHGYFPGETLIITEETRKQPLDTAYIYAMIKKHCF